MRRIALLFALIAMISTAVRLGNPSRRMDDVAAKVSRAGERVRRAVIRVCVLLAGRLRPSLPQSN